MNILYETYNHREYIHPDPLEFLYDYPDLRDREIVGLVASALAFGRVTQILDSVKRVLARMVPSPFEFLDRADLDRLLRTFAGFRHRYASGRELALTLYGTGQVIRRYGSLENGFAACLIHGDNRPAGPMIRFLGELMVDVKDDAGLLVPDPNGRSACKRMCLFLRWMVRHDEVDPGGWHIIGPDRLIVPLDTHMHRIGLALEFTQRRSADLRTAVEITEGFKTICPDDPVKFDFALTRLGIRHGLRLNGHPAQR